MHWNRKYVTLVVVLVLSFGNDGLRTVIGYESTMGYMVFDIQWRTNL